MFNENIVKIALENSYFRKVLFTTKNSQVVIMNIPPKMDIGEETHKVDQLLFFVKGEAKAILNDVPSVVHPNHLVVVPAGTKHNFINTGTSNLQLFTIYAPPQHAPNVVDKTKEEAERKQD